MTVFALFMFFTERPVSPFFGFFVFSLMGATLRWQWRGTLWTAVTALAAVIGMSLYPTDLFRDPEFELEMFIITIVCLAVVATLLDCLGAYEEKLRTELSGLAAWPPTVPEEAPAMAREMLEHTAGILGAPPMVLAWEEDEEPWLYLGLWSDGELQYTREPPASSSWLKGSNATGASAWR